METKLTLRLDGNIIEKSKKYAKAQKTSLSELIENYLQKIISENEPKKKITPLVKSLSGIIHLPKNYSHKKGYSKNLIDKYK